MQRGRKPKPTAIKVAEGNRGRRPLSPVDLTSSPEVPKPPTWLEPDARAIWKSITQELFRLKIIRSVDQTMLACLCDSIAMLRAARRKMTKIKRELRKEKKDPDEAMLYKTPGGSIIQSPLVGIINREKINIQRIASEFGMTATSRARLLSEELTGTQDDDSLDELDLPREDSDSLDDLTVQ